MMTILLLQSDCFLFTETFFLNFKGGHFNFSTFSLFWLNFVLTFFWLFLTHKNAFSPIIRIELLNVKQKCFVEVFHNQSVAEIVSEVSDYSNDDSIKSSYFTKHLNVSEVCLFIVYLFIRQLIVCLIKYLIFHHLIFHSIICSIHSINIFSSCTHSFLFDVINLFIIIAFN